MTAHFFGKSSALRHHSKISGHAQMESWPKTLKQHDHVQAVKQRNNMNDSSLQEWNGEPEHMG
jgi:hypothetical protein